MERVHLVTLGCARNETDSEELAGRLAADGFQVTDDAAEADAILVNTCGFIDAAKKDSIDTLLGLSDLPGKKLIAVGCLAERYGRDLAGSLPEVDAVLGFDSYRNIGAAVGDVLAGKTPIAHQPRDRRELLPQAPSLRHVNAGFEENSRGKPQKSASTGVPSSMDILSSPGRAPVPRQRLGNSPYAPLRIASGCDRRCAFCAIPSFRGRYLSRPIPEIVAEARWLADQGVKELLLVSENTSSYGKDLDSDQNLEALLPALGQVHGLDWIRVSYLQPAEITPGMLDAIAQTDKVVPYFDLSFQHAAPSVLRAMRRFGDPDSFLKLISDIRERTPQAGIRTNVILGFPGETEADVATLHDFLSAANLDIVGTFGYSDEEGTEAFGFDNKIPDDQIAERVLATDELVSVLCDDRAASRIGDNTQVLIEDIDPETGITGRTPFQGPEADGTTTLTGLTNPRIGQLVQARIIDSEGVDLIAEAIHD
jgi:ribosomal protein S12 methylthiotransferase RimO